MSAVALGARSTSSIGGDSTIRPGVVERSVTVACVIAEVPRFAIVAETRAVSPPSRTSSSSHRRTSSRVSGPGITLPPTAALSTTSVKLTLLGGGEIAHAPRPRRANAAASSA